MQLAHASGKRKAAATKAAAKRPTGAAQGRNPFAIASGAHTPESPAAAAASASPAPPGTQMDDDDEDDEAAEHALILAAQQAAREAAASKGSAAAPPAEPPVSVKDAPSAEAEPATASTGTATTNQQDAVQDGEPGKEADEENDDVPCTSTPAAPSVEQRVELGADDDDDDEDEDDEVAIRKAQERARAAAPPRCSDAGGGGSSPPEPIHPGMACDRSGQCPIVGFRYHLVGEDFDLCQAEYNKLPEEEQARYEKIAPPTAAASEAETAGAMSTTGVTTSTRHPARSILRMPQDASLASTNAARSLMRGPLAPRVVRYSSAGPHHHFLLACRVRPMTAVALGRWNWRSSAEAASRAIARRTSSASARCGPFIGSKRLARYDLWPARTNARCSLAHPRSRLLSDRRSRSRGASSTTLRGSSRARTSGSSCAP